MKAATYRKLFSLFALAMSLALPLHSKTFTEKVEEMKDRYTEEIPGLSLVSSEIQYEGLKVSNFIFDTEEKYTIVKPGEKIAAKLDYALDSNALENLNLHHYAYVLENYGSVGCLVHSLGLLDREGSTQIEFKAPEQKGVYKLFLYHAVGEISHDEVNQEVLRKEMPNHTLLGIVVVQ